MLLDCQSHPQQSSAFHAIVCHLYLFKIPPKEIFTYQLDLIPNLIMSCLFFFIFVCLAMHACNARHLGVVMDDNDVSNKKHLFSTKVVGSVKRLNKEQPTETSVKSIVFHERKGREERSKTAVGVSASGKELDERSGFFSDYSRPRTRPPSHN